MTRPSLQERLVTLKDFLSLSLSSSGLRCHISSACKSWRWRNSVEDGTDDVEPRRCFLLRNVITLQIPTKISNGLFVSGDKSCYEQIYGRSAGCFRPGAKWIYPPSLPNVGFSSHIVENWGRCAEECQKEACEYWTWASTSCSDCIPNNCVLFKGIQTGILRTEAETGVGHISGDRNCSDIEYVERDQGKVIPVADASQAEFPVGSCQTATAYCSALEVPGYRYVTCNFIGKPCPSKTD